MARPWTPTESRALLIIVNMVMGAGNILDPGVRDVGDDDGVPPAGGFLEGVRFFICRRDGLVRRTIHRKPCG
jgi:hypothetical protein